MATTDWLSATFWKGIWLVVILTVVFIFSLLGIFFLGLLWFGLTIWYLWRVIKGWMRLLDGNPAPSMKRYLVPFSLLLALAACGKADAPPAPKAGAGETITVTIGHAGPLTGSIAHQGKDDENGVALAIEQANDRKLKIGGKTVVFKMMSEDDQGDPKVGTLVAQKFVDAKVVAVIGHLNSGVTIPASNIYVKAGIPVISGSATNPELTERGMKGIFRTVGRDDQQGPAIAAYIVGEPQGQARGDRG